MAEWKSLEIQVPGKDLLEPVRNVLETLLIFLDVLKPLLSTIKIFLVDFGNPLRALVEALIKVIEELFLSLKTSGVSVMYHIPNPVIDPNFQFHAGYSAFPTTFKQSLFDHRDFNRPQPRAGSTRGGFILLVQADSPFALLGKVMQLLKFFSKEFTTPRFEEPRNFKVTPVGTKGDPILAVADLFAASPIKAVQLSWTLPTSAETPDVGFSDLISRTSQEFVPPKYLIEKSTINPASEVLDFSDVLSPEKAGKVEYERDVFLAGTTTPAKRREYLRDSNGELLVKFTETIVLDQLTVTSLIGQLGTFRYVDTAIEEDKTYYYRVRAFVGDLKLTTSGQLDWGKPIAADSREVPTVRWPSASSDDMVVAGKPTGILSTRIPKAFPDFDVVENLKRVLQSAFTLDFHRDPKNDPDFAFYSTGVGSLTNIAGVVSTLKSYDLMVQLSPLNASGLAQYSAANGTITYPWESPQVKKQSARVADILASALLETGSAALSQFQDLMQGPNFVIGASTMEGAVFASTGGTTKLSTVEKNTAFITSYTSDAYRTELLGVVSFLLSFMGSGLTPDWLAANPLRDIVPWSGQILYELLAKVQSLVDSFAGVVKEINNFIDLLVRKIATLERTLEFLLSILSLIESLQVGAYMLAVPEIEGAAVEWVRAVDSATNPPPKGPGGYSAGVALSYVAPDVTAFKTAFSIIFGV